MSHPFFIHWGIVSIQKPNNRTELVLNLRQLFKKKKSFILFSSIIQWGRPSAVHQTQHERTWELVFFWKALMSFFIQSTSVSTQIKQELGGTFFFPFKGSHHFSSNGRHLDEKSPITPH